MKTKKIFSVVSCLIITIFIFSFSVDILAQENTHKCCNKSCNNKPNTLTEKEIKQGWQLLFDGKTTKGWRGAYIDSFPAIGWKVEDGMLIVEKSGGGEAAHGGDIITEKQYSNFEFSVEFKMTDTANSGIKYFVLELEPRSPGSARGLEYQFLDDARYPTIDSNKTLGSLYDLIPASKDKIVKPLGEFNEARIIVDGKHVEHWLNGKKVLEFERGSDDFRDRVAKSKFKKIQGFGEYPEGHILLQDHGYQVFFRNIKIRELNSSSK